MTQEKQILLQDLSARLPYNVIGLYSWKNHEPYNRDLTGSLFDELKCSWDSTEDSQFLPYLRPMSNMTEEEVKEFYDVECMDAKVGYIKPTQNWHFTINGIDLLNAHNFDYRGLIPKDLAISTEVFNPYK